MAIRSEEECKGRRAGTGAAAEAAAKRLQTPGAAAGAAPAGTGRRLYKVLRNGLAKTATRAARRRGRGGWAKLPGEAIEARKENIRDHCACRHEVRALPRRYPAADARRIHAAAARARRLAGRGPQEADQALQVQELRRGRQLRQRRDAGGGRRGPPPGPLRALGRGPRLPLDPQDRRPHPKRLLHGGQDRPRVRGDAGESRALTSGAPASGTRKPVQLVYHQATFDLLGREPVFSDAARVLFEERERACGARFPAAVREWYSLDGAVDILRMAIRMFRSDWSRSGRWWPIGMATGGGTSWPRVSYL